MLRLCDTRAPPSGPPLNHRGYIRTFIPLATMTIPNACDKLIFSDCRWLFDVLIGVELCRLCLCFTHSSRAVMGAGKGTCQPPICNYNVGGAPTRLRPLMTYPTRAIGATTANPKGHPEQDPRLLFNIVLFVSQTEGLCPLIR